MKKSQILMVCSYSLVVIFSSSAFGARSSKCTDPAFIEKVISSFNGTLKSEGAKARVAQAKFTGYGEEGGDGSRFCSYYFKYKNGEEYPFNVELKKNGKFIVRGEE